MLYSDSICYCGYTRSKHTTLAIVNSQGEQVDRGWKVNVDTETQPTDAFGDIEFLGLGQKIGKVSNELSSIIKKSFLLASVCKYNLLPKILMCMYYKLIDTRMQ